VIYFQVLTSKHRKICTRCSNKSRDHRSFTRRSAIRLFYTLSMSWSYSPALKRLSLASHAPARCCTLSFIPNLTYQNLRGTKRPTWTLRGRGCRAAGSC